MQQVQNTETSVSSKIMENLMQPDDKALIGRLGVITMRIQKIITDGMYARNPHQVLLGKNYLELTDFCCSWCSHKNAKVR